MIEKDPRWKPFVARYAADCTRFAIECCGMAAGENGEGGITHQQIELLDGISQQGARVSVSSGHGCFGIDTEIMRADGSIAAVQDIVVGDRLMGGDGCSTRNVLGLYRGKENLYRFTYRDNTSHVFNESHILCLVATNTKGRRFTGQKITVTVREWLNWGEDKQHCHAIYRSSVSVFQKSSDDGQLTPIPPYILGAWLGDGSIGRVEITNVDDEVIDALDGYAKSLGIIPTKVKRRQQPDNKVNQRPNLHFGIKSVEPLGLGDYYGFELDGDHKFLGGDFTVLHNSGKTRSIGVATLWHLLCYYQSNTIITAPKITQVRNQAWKEMRRMLDALHMGAHGWLWDYIQFDAERIYVKGHKETWFVIAKTAPKGSPENLAGEHADWLMIWADEASGIPDANFGVLGGAMTDRRNRFVLTSQPTRNAGFFYDTHHSLSADNGGTWLPLVFSSEDSPLVSDAFIAEKLDQYGGRNDTEYQIKVLGIFPEESDKYLLGRSRLEACFDKEVIDPAKPYGYMVLCDVGLGEYRDSSVIVVAKVQGWDDFGEDSRRVQVIAIPFNSNARQLRDFEGEIANISEMYENAVTLIDAGGMGGGVCQNLEASGRAEVVRVIWGKPCDKNRNKERFINKRAQAMVGAARAAKEGRLGISVGVPYKKSIVDEGSRIPYFFDNQTRYQIASKQDMASQGIGSPDLWDAICFAFMEGASFNTATASQDSQDYKLSVVQQAQSQLQAYAMDRFGDVD
jgi:hypothetical protein